MLRITPGGMTASFSPATMSSRPAASVQRGSAHASDASQLSGRRMISVNPALKGTAYASAVYMAGPTRIRLAIAYRGAASPPCTRPCCQRGWKTAAAGSTASITAQACSVRLWRLVDFRSPPVSPWPMQSKATEPMPCATNALRSSPKRSRQDCPGAVQNQQARRLLPGHERPPRAMAVTRYTEDAFHRCPPQRALRRPDERVRRRATAASKTERVPQISTRERARVMAV